MPWRFHLAAVGLAALAALAVDSDPSNCVGFIARSVPAGQTVAFSACPLETDVGVPAAQALGPAGASGDAILVWQGFWASYAWTADGHWGGLLLDYNGTYLYRNGHGAATSLVVAGRVIPDGATVVLADFGSGYQAFGNPLPMDIDLDEDDLTLPLDGFSLGDKILDWVGFWSSYTFYGSTYGVDLLAGKAYIFWIQNPFVWEIEVHYGPAAPAAATAAVRKPRARTDDRR